MPRLRPLPLLLAALAATSFLPAPLASARGLEVRDMIGFQRLSEPAITVDGTQLTFTVRDTDYPANKGVNSIWIQNLRDGGRSDPAKLTPAGMTATSPAFAPGGTKIYFISGKSGSDQVWVQLIDGSEPMQVTNFPVDVNNFKLSPDGKRLAVSLDVFTDCADLACTKKRLDETSARKATGVLFDKLFIRHWDSWADGRRSQLYTAPIGADGKVSGEPVLISKGIDGDVPSKPFGDAAEYNFSPDSTWIAFDARVAGKSEPWSTNFDIFVASADGRVGPRNLTAANKAWDAGPVFSHDGRTLYYRAMKRPGFEADRFALMAMDFPNGQPREIAPGWDRSADDIVVSPDDKSIYTTAEDMGQHPLFEVDVASGAVKRIVGDGRIGAALFGRGRMVFLRDTLTYPATLFYGTPDGSEAHAISHFNDDRLRDVAMGAFEQFDFPGWNGEAVHGYVVKPWNYQPGHKYPVAFLIHGGPQGSFGNDWSYRWNPEWYAGQGYAVVMIDFHGSTGYGQAFEDAISQHWGDRPLEDLQKGWAAALSKYSFLDGKNACALGASYGGYMVYWLAGNWTNADGSRPFKCLVDHDGVFDNRMMGYSTEELWFSEWENGGTPWANPAGYERFNPVLHVADWSMPMLVVHSQMDLRIPVEQGIGAFTALQRKGIESKFLYFPNESHWVLKPQNSVMWHETVAAWLKAHLQ